MNWRPLNLLACAGVLAALSVAAAPSAHADPVVVGYYTDYNPGSTAPSGYITLVGDTPVQITDIGAANFGDYGKLFLLEPANGSPTAAFLGSAGDLADFVNGGGLLMLHSRNVAQGVDDNALLPGGAGITLVTFFGTNIDVNTPGTLVTNGPFGTINNSTLDGGNWSFHGYALVGTLPAGAVSILSDGDPNHSVAFYYPFGNGWVYYSTIPLDFYLGGAGNNPPGDSFRNIYTPNAITFVDSLATVPEPVSALLFVGGLVGVAVSRRRRRNVLA